MAGDTMVGDNLGNWIPQHCPHCGGVVIPQRDGTGAIYGGQCAACHSLVSTVQACGHDLVQATYTTNPPRCKVCGGRSFEGGES